MKRPLLSIIIPTRERASMLEHTLQTVLALQNPAFEVVISDNASADGTQDLVARFSDPRLRYSRSEKRLSMPENFERGLHLASGEFLITLGDDDLIIEENLELALALLAERDCDLVFWNRGYFYWGTYPDQAMAGSFGIPTGRGHYPVDAYTLLTLTYRGLVSYPYLPGIYNSVFRRSFLDTYCRYLRGRHFPEYVISVDAFSALVFCSLSPRSWFAQSPVSVSCISPRSNGMSLAGDRSEYTRFSEELGYADPSLIMPDEFTGKVHPVTSLGLSHLGVLADYFNVVKRLLNYMLPAPPSLDILANTYLRWLLADGHVRIAPDAEPYGRLLTPGGTDPIIREDLLAYFFKLWSIPLPQLYAGKFSGNTATVRDLHLHLTSIGFNRPET